MYVSHHPACVSGMPRGASSSCGCIAAFGCVRNPVAGLFNRGACCLPAPRCDCGGAYLVSVTRLAPSCNRRAIDSSVDSQARIGKGFLPLHAFPLSSPPRCALHSPLCR
jgi:hypothetical protein